MYSTIPLPMAIRDFVHTTSQACYGATAAKIMYMSAVFHIMVTMQKFQDSCLHS